jgi:large subunit ribosomal protein L22
MVDFGYAFKAEEGMAKAYGRGLGISTKKSVEICNAIRRKPVQKAKAFLERVLKMEDAVPMKRYNQDAAHRKGMAGGKYPLKATREILKIIESAESNAHAKGLSKELVIVHISAHLAQRPWHYGRQKRSKMKRTHIQVVLMEKKQKSVKPKESKND